MKNFVVYRSSAGSGKTFTLVKEYLRLALADPRKLESNYKRILAITFTNKAAAEMKERVIGTLNSILAAPTLPFAGTLLRDELLITEDELKRRAAVVLSSILHHYSDLSIGTIDSFTHRIVKTFAHDLQLPVNFNIETDSRTFYEKVVATLLAQVGEDPYVSQLLKEYVLLKAEDNRSWDPEQQILAFSDLLQKEDAPHFTSRLSAFTSDELEGFRRQFIDFKTTYTASLKSNAQRALALIAQAGLTDDDFAYKATGPQNFFRKCLDGSVTRDNALTGRIVDAIASKKWLGKNSEKQSAFAQIEEQLHQLAVQLVDTVRSQHTYYELCDALSRQMYPLMLLKKIDEISTDKKAEDKLVFISEFNNRIFDMVNNEPTPFIYERLGERYHHYLLDEFQDTSSLQWQNLLPLIDNSLSAGWYNLVVGDGKQSIYRWRNANVKQFAALPELDGTAHNPVTAARANSLKRNFEAQLLATNYRSLPEVVAFNNAFFGELSEQLLQGSHRDIYRDQEQRAKTHTGGYVTLDTATVEKADMDLHTLQRIKHHLHQALADGFAYSDVCILVRQNAHGNTVADFLLRQGVPVISSDSLLLKHNTEIHTVVACLTWMVNSRDHVSAAAVLHYLYTSQRIVLHDYHTGLRDLAAEVPLFTVLARFGIHLKKDELALNNLFDTCVGIIDALGLHTKAWHYLRFFLDEVNEFLTTKNSGIPAFFDWWATRREKASMIIPAGTNAVQVMTIHASKGLEFPVVLVPYCNWPVYRNQEKWVELKQENVGLPVAVLPLTKRTKDIGFAEEVDSETHEQTLDNLNLLYVAFTRAVERLHVIAASTRVTNKPSVAQWIRGFASHSGHAAADELVEFGQRAPKISSRVHAQPELYPLLPLRFDANPNAVRIKASWLQNSSLAEQARRTGINMHRTLALIHHRGDLDTALETTRLEGLFTPSEQDELRQRLLAVLEHPELAAYFNEKAEVLREAELITQSGQLLRPDRVVFNGPEVVLLDYKTGKENTDKYRQQLSDYAAALQALGHKNVKKLIVYLDDLQIVTL